MTIIYHVMKQQNQLWVHQYKNIKSEWCYSLTWSRATPKVFSRT